MKNKFISIIIPVYNEERYLENCVTSLTKNLKEKRKEIEILLIDDGSTDQSSAICDHLAQNKEFDIKVFHKKNGGLSDARNFGLNNASGEFICFIDSDDYVDENILAAFDEIQKNKTLSDVFEFDLIFHSNDKVYSRKTFQNLVDLKYFNQAKKVILPTTWRNSAIIRIIRRDFLLKNNLFFKENLLAEDYDLLSRIWLSSEKIYMSSFKFYHYIRQRPNSITTSIKKKFFIDLINSSLENYNLVKKSSFDMNIKKLIYQFITFNILAALRKIKVLPKSEQNEVLELIKSNRFLLDFPSTIKTKLFVILYKIVGLKNALKFV